jgi:hypothetical protein
VPCGNGDDPPNASTKPLLPGAIPDPFIGTAKLAGLTCTMGGRSLTASNVTKTADALPGRKTLKSVPIAPDNAVRPR